MRGARPLRDQVLDFGQSRKDSSRIALCASSIRKSSLPAAASLAICRSQLSSTSSNQLTNSSRSFTDNAPAAFLISSTVLTPKIISRFLDRHQISNVEQQTFSGPSQ